MHKEPSIDISSDQLLRLVVEISDELHPGQNFGDSISLDSALDAELGLDSLSKMELVHRIESQFELSLSERALTLSETPRDLLRELTSGASRKGSQQTIKVDEFEHHVRGDVTRPPNSAETLNTVLAWQAEYNASIPHLHILGENEQKETLTYFELYSEACDLASGLLANDLTPGESVLVMLPTGRAYFVSFFGVLLAGGVPVPVYPPARPQQLEEHLKRHTKIASNARAVIMITVEEAITISKSMAAQVQGMRRITTCEELSADKSENILPVPSPRDTAFLQYTSGSTGDPKGVILSHANLLSNIRAMGHSLEAGSKDVFVSWLPLYHDMGLIGAWLGSLTFGMPLVIMNPLSFLARPQRWLWAIHKYKGTISGGPNFAYEACTARIRAEDIEGLDLSSWRVAFNGAEAVQPDTLKKFRDRFGPYGFNPASLMPVYGLAENSVGLAFPPLGRGPKIDRIDRKILATKNKAIPLGSGASATAVLKIPACGHPLSGHQIRVVDGTGREVSERCQGHIQFQGPSSTSGYFQNKDSTATLFDGNWLNTGDLGYLADGEIHITGREKDMIIRAGRNIYPIELETAVGELDGIQRGNVAVFSSPNPNTGIDRLVVMAESRRKEKNQISEIRKTINRLSSELTGTTPDEIVLVAPRSVPKTSSGKIRRQAARAFFEKGYVRQSPIAAKWQLALLLLSLALKNCTQSYRTAVSWIYAIYVWSITTLLAMPVWLGVALIPKISLRWAFLRVTLSTLRQLAGIRIIVEGEDKLSKVGPIIIVANHASYIDGAVLISSLPGQFRFVAKAELRENILSRVFLKRLNTLFVERFDAQQSVQDAKHVAETLMKNERIVYFPEGTFTRMPGLLPFHMGAFAAAVDAGTPIVPIVMRGTRSILRDNSGFPRFGLVHVKVLDAIDHETYVSADRWGQSLELRDKVRGVILAHCAEPDLAHEMVLRELSEKRRQKSRVQENG